MKIYKQILSVLAIIIGCHAISSAQLCVDASVSIGPDGTLLLDPLEVLNFQPEPDQTAIVIPALFTCEDIGTQRLVTVYLLEGQDTIYTCRKNVTILDKIRPVAVCRPNVHVQLNNNGYYRFSFADVNDNSFDACSEVTSRKFIPDRITCTDPNPIAVQMVVMDEHLNFDTCTFLASYDHYQGPTDTIQCRDSISFFMYKFDADVIQHISPRNVLTPGARGCQTNYALDLFNGITPRPGDSLTIDDTASIVTAVITELASGEQCSTFVSVIGWEGDPCTTAPIICDSKCHDTPFGNCESGHTDDDGIELPCDVYIDDWCPLSEYYPDPAFIESLGYPRSENAWPTYGPTYANYQEFITNENNVSSIFVGYWDKVTDQQTGKQIIRTWTILEWCSQNVIEFEQIIFLEYRVTTICDTLPWNTPFFDCDSGHTFEDDIEWPADITVHTLFITPKDLEENPEVLSQNVRPEISATCTLTGITYTDQAFVINDTTRLIKRKWSVIDWVTVEIWDYTQDITVIWPVNGSLVCVTLENEIPMADVTLVPGITTDTSGCHVFEDPDGIIITPSKDAPIYEGVNILDQMLLVQHILGTTTLTPLQRRAADLNQSQTLSSIDIIEYRKLFFDILDPAFGDSWQFFEKGTSAQSVDITDPLLPYRFYGIKMGDIDNSAALNINYDDIMLRTADEVLNSGETYSIPFYLEAKSNVIGFSLRFSNPSQSFSFASISVPHLPFFDANAHFYNGGDYAVIHWYAPVGDWPLGIPLDTNQPLFVLDIHANEDVIMNEELRLEGLFDNLLVSANSPMQEFILAFEDIVISSVIELDNGRKIEFYPNPASDILHLKGVLTTENGEITLIDPTGRIALQEKMQPSLDISKLATGMYYIIVTIDGERSYASPLIKM